MPNNHEIIERLTKLREKKKFTDADWLRRGLNPSDADKVNVMIQLTNTCLDELLVEVQSGSSENQLKKALVKGLKRFNTSDYDTEEKEFIGDEFQAIGSILGLDIAGNLNTWLYGKLLGTIIQLTKKKEVILDKKSFECTACKLPLNVNVTATREGIPSYWIIAQCNQCAEYNLVSTGKNASGLKFENFVSVETLNGNETSEDEAKTRLEQIKYFRGKK